MLCLPQGPGYMTSGGSTAAGMFKIIQTPSLVIFLNPDMTYRQIFMDGRALEKDPNPSWMGYSVGHWDGDTLVVESLGFNDRTWLDRDGPGCVADRSGPRHTSHGAAAGPHPCGRAKPTLGHSGRDIRDRQGGASGSAGGAAGRGRRAKSRADLASRATRLAGADRRADRRRGAIRLQLAHAPQVGLFRSPARNRPAREPLSPPARTPTPPAAE